MKNLKKLSMNKMVKISLGLTIALSVGFGTTTMSAFASTATSSTSLADSIISTAKHYMGTPYKYGSTTGNTSTFDCSSFTQEVFKENGVSLPRDSRQQSQVGTYVARNNLQPGDLVFFYSPIHHVAIYIGNGQIIHDYGSPGVTISNLNSGWWSSHYTTARRVLPSSAQAAPVVKSPVSTTPVSTTPTATPAAPVSQNIDSLSMTSQAKSELAYVQSFLAKNGVKSYTNIQDWSTKAETVSKNNLNRGDVMFFATSGKTINHVGIYAGNGQVLYKTSSTSQTYSLNSSFVQNSFVTAKRAQ